MNQDVDNFIAAAKQWRDEIIALRAVVLVTKLDETVKWRLPCYCRDGSNVAIIQPFKSCLALMFFKGSLLKDAKGLLVDNGPNSQASCRLEFHSVAEIKKMGPTIKAYLKEAMTNEELGLKVKLKKRPEPVPEALQAAFRKNSRLAKAFANLTPGRQRAYILHIASAKQAATREARIQKHAERILAGKGLTDR